MKPSDFAFASCPPQQQTATCVAEASAVELEFLPDLLGHTSRGVVPSHHHSFGKQLGADVTRFQAFGEVFGNTAAYLWVEVHDAGFHGWSGTGFLVAPRLLVTAGHVLDPIEGNLILDGNMSGYAAFHDRVGCNQKLLHLVDPQYRNDASHDYGQVATRCHPVFGAPGLAFGRVYLRLWKFCGGKTQRAATVGHFGGKPLQVFSRLVREPDVRCSFWGDSNCVHLADSDDESDGGGSGAPVLDMDGAVRAIYSHSVPAIFDDNDKVGYRLDAAARLSPDIRKVVHDQAPKVARINRHANGPGTDLLIDAVMNRFLQVTTLSVPANAVRLQDPSFVPPETIVSPVAPRGFPEGWSIFYFEERSGHLMHLQTRADGGVRIPDDVIHQDVSVLANLCDIGPTGVIHSWYEIPERYQVETDLVLKRHVLASERVGAETTLVHLVQDGDRRWTKTTIGGARNLGFASAGCTAYDPVDWIGPGTVRADCTAGLAACAAANERDGIVSRGRNVNQYRVHQPHPFVAFVEGRNLCVSEWSPAGGWLRLHTLPVLSGEVRVEAVTMWHGEGAGGEGRLNIAYVTGAPDMPRTLWYVRRDGPANWYRERMIDLHGFTDRVARTLSLTAADSSTGGDVCWQVEGTDGRGRVLMLSLRGSPEIDSSLG